MTHKAQYDPLEFFVGVQHIGPDACGRAGFLYDSSELYHGSPIMSANVRRPDKTTIPVGSLMICYRCYQPVELIIEKAFEKAFCVTVNPRH